MIAFVGALCGIGGGLFAVPLLHYGFRLPLRASVATSLCLVWANALSSTASELLHPGSAFQWSVVLPLIGGALVGAQFGYLASKRLPQRAIKSLFALVMLGAGLRLLLGSTGATEVFEGTLDLGPKRALAVATIGLCAGVASPLLGIGGGLIVVPGLLFAVPEVGMLGARAAALGNAVVTSSRSLQLYRGEGAIERTLVPWVVVGALAGAVGGVQVVHLEGAASLGRIVLSVLLLLTAVRMGLDALRGPRTVTPATGEPA